MLLPSFDALEFFMQPVLILTGLLVLVWGSWKLGEPWRKYYAERIAPLEKELSTAESRRADKECARRQANADAELFTRDFRAEVGRHQKAKSEAYDYLNPLREKKSNLHDAMDDVRSSIDSWHRGSRSFFGNKGRKIKDDSILGWFGLEQTVAQKENLESRRGAISSEIANLKDEMSDVYERRIKPAKEGIKAAFDDEKRLKNFKQNGLHERHFRTKAEELALAIAEIDAEIVRLKAAISEANDNYKKRRPA